MSIGFWIADDLAGLQARVREFVVEQVMPMEGYPRQGPHGPEQSLCRELIDGARGAGLRRRPFGGASLELAKRILKGARR